MQTSNGGQCFDNVIPNILYLARHIRTCHYDATSLGVHVVINGELHLCETEALSIAVLDSNVKCNEELYVYCAETETLVLHGIGVVTGVSDCAYHIKEILDGQVEARLQNTSEGKGDTNDPHDGSFNKSYEG